MCIGIPMRVERVEGLRAFCVNEPEQQQGWADLGLLERTPGVGEWIIVFMGAAREIVPHERLQAVLDAREAMRAALSGENVDTFFADLVDREPPLPPHLQAMVNKSSGGHHA
jgi:hydrogenase expression/formation protein HypC